MAAHQAPPSLGLSQQEYWSGLPFPFSNAWKWKVKVKSLSRVRPSATPWTAAFQAPPSMGFSRQEYWSWVPLSPLQMNSYFTTIEINISNMENVFHLHTALHFSNSDLSYWNLGQAEYLTAPNPFYLFLTLSLFRLLKFQVTIRRRRSSQQMKF